MRSRTVETKKVNGATPAPDRYCRKRTLLSNAYQLLYRFHIPIRPKSSSSRCDFTICHEKKFMWFRVAKVGTRAILAHLKRNRVELAAGHANNVYCLPPHFRDCYKFAFVRNPWDRLVSCWLNKVVNSNCFNFSKSTYVRM